jgi:uncharacterized protein (TIGR03437 family)
MQNRSVPFPIAILLFLLPVAAMAGFNGAPTLTAGQTLSLDTGAVAASGGDILWNGSIIAFQGSAIGLDLGAAGVTGNVGYDYVEEESEAYLANYQSQLTGGSLQTSSSAPNSVIAVYTNGGNYAVLLVTAQSGTSITLQYLTFAATPPGPFISQALNNYSLIPAGLPNSAIAPGSLFIIMGSGLAGATTVSALQSSANGLPASLNGTSVSLTDSNGTTTSPAFYYAINSQLALVMPSGAAIGPAVLTVAYNGQTSPPFTIQVARTAMGFAAYYGTGMGLGIATDPNTGAFFGYSNPIPPGATVVLWGSGLGADPARDTTFTPGAFSINNLAQIYIGGMPAGIQYQGASGYPGVNQINVVIPQNVPTGCFVSVVGVTAGGIPTNAVVLPIANTSCEEPALGWTSSSLAHLSGQQSVNSGVLEMDYATVPNADFSGSQIVTSATASFQTLPGTNYGVSSGAVSVGGCILNNFPNASTAASAPLQGLNAGLITIGSPNTFNRPVTLLRDTTTLEGFYGATLPGGFLTTTGGMFTLTGTAGSQIGAFTAQITFSDPLLVWNNQDAASFVLRFAGLPVTWTGGDSGTIVTISGTAFGAGSTAQFLCATTADAGQFTVPAWILAAFPAGAGYVTVGNQTLFQPFSATGLDRAYTRGLVVDEILTDYF